MSNMFLALERARSLCYFAVAAINEDTPNRATAVAMAKAASDDCQNLVGRESIQSFGGIGFTWEHDCPPLRQAGHHRRRALRRRGRALRRRRRQSRRHLRLSPGRTAPQRPGEPLIAALDLAPHPEGGWYRRTWVAEAADGRRPAGSAIYYLLLPVRSRRRTGWTPPSCGTSTPVTRSSCAASGPTGAATCRCSGTDVAAGQVPQVVVDAGVWQSAPPARVLRPRRGDGDARLHLRGLRAPSGAGGPGLSDQAPVGAGG